MCVCVYVCMYACVRACGCVRMVMCNELLFDNCLMNFYLFLQTISKDRMIMKIRCKKVFLNKI